MVGIDAPRYFAPATLTTLYAGTSTDIDIDMEVGSNSRGKCVVEDGRMRGRECVGAREGGWKEGE
jgi:hypothetical protein